MIGGAAVFFNFGVIFDATNGNCFGAAVFTVKGVIDGGSDDGDTGDEPILIDDPTDNSADVGNTEHSKSVIGEVLGVDIGDIGQIP